MTFEQYTEQYQRLFDDLCNTILASNTSKDKRLAYSIAKRIQQKTRADIGQLLQQVEQQAFTINRQALTIEALER